MPPARPYLPWIVAAPFTVSGAVHFIRPQVFTGVVPHALPWHVGLVYASGVAELICAYGLWRRQRWAGIASALLLLAIWPANLQDAITTQHRRDMTATVFTWVRFPLQLPLIWFALQAGQSRSAGGSRSEVTQGRA